MALSDQKNRNITSTSVEITVSTNFDDGIMYWIIDPDEGEPTEDQVRSGLNSQGDAAFDSGNYVVSTLGEQPWISITGLSSTTRA